MGIEMRLTFAAVGLHVIETFLFIGRLVLAE